MNSDSMHRRGAATPLTTTRRRFLARASGIAAAAACAPAPLALARTRLGARGAAKPMKLLMLGGTAFLGPHIVWEALARGHEVTLFNRGRTNPELFGDLEQLTGDRYGDLASLEAAVGAGRTWDAAIDTFAYVPRVVTDAIEVLRPAIQQYVVVSTISVYADSATPGADEDAPLAEVADEIAADIHRHTEVGMHYGAMKARCERAAEEGMPGRVTSVRPGLIVGPRDTSGRFTYWPVRASEGGTMIGPGDGSDPTQFIDVRDLAAFIVRCVERKHVGAYNADRPAGATTMRDLIEACRRIADAQCEVEWIPGEFLLARGVRPWQELPAWVPPEGEYAGFGRRSTERAGAAGLRIRPLEQTVRATLEYYRTRGPEIDAEHGAEAGTDWRRRVRGGLAAAREEGVLREWRAHQQERRPDPDGGG